MKILLSLILVLFLTFPVFAYTDIGLLKSPRTISYFVLVPTDSTSPSSGLVYNQKQNEKFNLEISYTSYKSLYLLTNNITKLRFDEKYKFIDGPITLVGLAGPAIYYSPSVGAGLAIDAGGVLSAGILNNLAVAFSLSGTFFRDGLEFDAEPAIYFAPEFINDNLEFYLGGRIEGAMVGYSFDGTQGGKVNFYANAGIRTKI